MYVQLFGQYQTLAFEFQNLFEFMLFNELSIGMRMSLQKCQLMVYEVLL